MKLLQINVTANWGSTGKIAESIGMCAMRNGWESYIAYGRYANKSESTILRVGDSLDTYWHYGMQRIADNEGLNSKLATKRLVEDIKRITPDIIQLHVIHDHYLNYQVLFEYLNSIDIKVVWTFHDCWAFTGHCFHFVTKKCEKWKKQCSHCPLRNEYPKTLLDRSTRNFELKKRLFSANQNLTIVSCSRWMEQFVKDSFLKGKRVQTIYNGVNLGVFTPMAIDNPSKLFTVLAVSSVWTQKKGLLDICILRELLPVDIQIILVGVTAKQQKSLPRGVIGILRTQNIHELVRLYNESGVLINPTYADTFPTVNLEAMACGTPVITYRTGGSPEAVTKDTGFVVEQGDVRALADAIMTVRSNGKEQYSEACRRRAEQYFDKDKCYQQYIDLYNALIKENCDAAR